MYRHLDVGGAFGPLDPEIFSNGRAIYRAVVTLSFLITVTRILQNVVTFIVGSYYFTFSSLLFLCLR
jgi:hypothetical protein